jgi:hypothetical protein
VNQRQLHDRIRRAFGAFTRPPRPELSERIRDSLWGRQVSDAAPFSLPGYSCAAQSGGGGPATMTTARAGVQNGFDRFVIQFSGGVPGYEVTPQDSASFAQEGGPVTLAGSAGLAVVLRNATGAGAFSGPRDLQPGFAEIKEARLLSDSQGVVEWGIGIGRVACFRAWTLPGPPRLVIDIASG